MLKFNMLIIARTKGLRDKYPNIVCGYINKMFK